MRNRSTDREEPQFSWIKFGLLPLELSIVNSMCSLRYPVLPTLLARKVNRWKSWTLKTELSTLHPILCTPPKKAHQFLERWTPPQSGLHLFCLLFFLKCFQCTTNTWVMLDFFYSVPRNSHHAIQKINISYKSFHPCAKQCCHLLWLSPSALSASSILITALLPCRAKNINNSATVNFIWELFFASGVGR